MDVALVLVEVVIIGDRLPDVHFLQFFGKHGCVLLLLLAHLLDVCLGLLNVLDGVV